MGFLSFLSLSHLHGIIFDVAMLNYFITSVTDGPAVCVVKLSEFPYLALKGHKQFNLPSSAFALVINISFSGSRDMLKCQMSNMS